MTKLVLVLAFVFGTAGLARAEQVDAPAPAQPAGDARAICVTALQQDATFAEWVLEKGYQVQSARCDNLDEAAAKRRLKLDRDQHETAAVAVSRNERHVVLAYAAMWIVAAGFLIFLWRRQQTLRAEIEHLRKELDVAVKDGK